MVDQRHDMKKVSTFIAGALIETFLNFFPLPEKYPKVMTWIFDNDENQITATELY